MEILCLVNLSKRGMIQLGEVNRSTNDFIEVKRIMEKACDENFNKIGYENYLLFLAENDDDGIFKAKFVSEIDFNERGWYTDVAENDIRFMFHRSVNLPEDEQCTCIGCNKVMNTEDPNDLCSECHDRL